MKRPRAAPQRRLLVASHSHPHLTPGGGELAAFRLHEAVAAEARWQSWFLAAVPMGSQRWIEHFVQPFGPQEYVFEKRGFDHFKFANRSAVFPGEFSDLLQQITADLVHFHHYSALGVESFLAARRALPGCRIVLTLHEFLAICNNHGQMIKRDSNLPCHESSPAACARCYPEFSRADFFLRKAYITRFFDLVDHFIAPSHMLAGRYVDWGVPQDRISVIENIPPPLPTPAAKAKAQAPDGARVLRIGYFGQISALKGLNVLLDAASILLEDNITGIRIDIHGDWSNQPEHLVTKVKERLAEAGRNVRFHGPYDNGQVDSLMQRVDAVVVPSIWWENSPLVIQEALRNRRPVICSDIGGMAEKVRDGLDGYHFPVGNAGALADLLAALATDRTKLTRLAKTLHTPAPSQDILRQHVVLYEKLLAAPPRVPAA